MFTGQRPGQVVYTNKAKCRDCYRCVRACPVKAIAVVDGQAFVDNDTCIACGTCIRECPQGAKTYRNDIDKATELLHLMPKKRIAVSLAPSFAGSFAAWELKRIPSALRVMGFEHVSETSIGAYMLAQSTKETLSHPTESQFFSSCPAFVAYVQHKVPQKAKHLMPYLSPMAIHAKYLKTHHGIDAVVFVGPCIAKKREAESADVAPWVDCVLTFDELRQWLVSAKVDLKKCEESAFDLVAPKPARVYSLEGGALSLTFGEAPMCDAVRIAACGEAKIKALLSDDAPRTVIAETLFCDFGCADGPGTEKNTNPFDKVSAVMRYAATPQPETVSSFETIACGRTFTAPQDSADTVSEEQLQEALQHVGKYSKDDELNCGACGYSSCRDKARAVVKGFAESQMCLPYMRMLAERKTDKIIESSPNGIVIMDSDLKITYMNPAFSEMFSCTPGVLGKHISYLMDPEPYERVRRKEIVRFDKKVIHHAYNIVAREVIYPIEEGLQYAAFFINISKSDKAKEELVKFKHQALAKARKLHEHQIKSIQNLAQALGEYAARGEELVDTVIETVEGIDDT